MMKSSTPKTFAEFFGPTGFSFAKSIDSTNATMEAARTDDLAGALNGVSPITPRLERGRAPVVHGQKEVEGAAEGEQETGSNNVYKGEEATLPSDCNTLVVRFNLTVSDHLRRPHACNIDALQSFRDLHAKIVASPALGEVCEGIARNVLDGYWLWRNAEATDELVVRVSTKTRDGVKTWAASGYEDASTRAAVIADLGAAIKGVFSDSHPPLQMKVEARLKLGEGAHVFPSQLMKIDASKDEKYREFYRTYTHSGEATAGMRAVKIMNRIRTIDDRSQKARELELVVPVSAYGTLLQYSVNLREGEETFYAIVTRAIQGAELTDDEMFFLTAQLIFGGLFTQKGDKKERAAKKAGKGGKAAAEVEEEAAS